MEWIILFVAAWTIFFILVDWKQLKVTFWCGLLAMILNLIIDRFFLNQGMYEIHNGIFYIFGSSVFFTFGSVLVSAIMIAQFQSYKRWIRILHPFFFVSVFAIEEILLVSRGVLIYNDWNILRSIIVDILAIIVLSWFSIVVLKRGGYKV